MICTLIVNSEKLKNIYEKRDCPGWQPLTLISDETRAYIEKTGNERTRLERFAAYTLLFSAANDIFGAEIESISRDEFGKPYISKLKKSSSPKEEKEIKNSTQVLSSEKGVLGEKIYFSISHSDGIAAVTLSDEGECGVDLQAMPDGETAGRVEKRFLSSFVIDEKNDCVATFQNIKYGKNSEKLLSAPLPRDLFFLCFAEPTGSGFDFLSEPPEKEFSFIKNDKDVKFSFLKKWTLCEAILKCSCAGFREIRNVNALKEQMNLWFTPFTVKEELFGLSVALNKNVNNR